MVPLAINADRLTDTPGGRRVRELVRKTGWPQGVWVCDAEGRSLAFHYFRAKPGEAWAAQQTRWKVETLAAVEAGLTAFGPVTPRKAAALPPDRGRGIRPDGSIRLAVVVRPLDDGPPAVDGVTWPAEQWKSLRPGPVPEPIARSLAPALSPMTDSIFVPRPADVAGRLSIRRRDATHGEIHGPIGSRHFRDGDPNRPIRVDGQMTGAVGLDPVTGEPRRILWIFRGTYRHEPPHDKPRPIAASISWSR